MEDTYKQLGVANKDLEVLNGKKIELSRERSRLNNHRQVFLEELKRIEGELETVDQQLNSINTEHKSTSWKVIKLRFQLFFQILMRCVHQVYTLLAFLFLNFLHVTYVTLSLSASVTKTILESQEKEQATHDQATSVDVVYMRRANSSSLKSG